VARSSAFRGRPVRPVTYNLLMLLDKLEKFEVVRDEGDSSSSCTRRKRRCCGPSRCRSRRRRSRTLSERYRFKPEGPILIEIFPGARRFRGPHARSARHDRRARRLLRARRHHGLAARAAARHVLVGGDALARDGARLHAADVEAARAALADRGDLGARGSGGAAGMGPGHGGVVRRRAPAGRRSLKLAT
jgi:hypothetical protein